MNRDLPSISINERVVFTSRLPAEEGGAGEGVGTGVGRHKITFTKNIYTDNHYDQFFSFKTIVLVEAVGKVLENFTFSVQFCLSREIVPEKAKKITVKKYAKNIMREPQSVIRTFRNFVHRKFGRRSTSGWSRWAWSGGGAGKRPPGGGHGSAVRQAQESQHSPSSPSPTPTPNPPRGRSSELLIN